MGITIPGEPIRIPDQRERMVCPRCKRSFKAYRPGAKVNGVVVKFTCPHCSYVFHPADRVDLKGEAGERNPGQAER